MDFLKKLNFTASEHQKRQQNEPKRSRLNERATQDELKRTEEYYKQKPGSISEKIRKIFE